MTYYMIRGLPSKYVIEEKLLTMYRQLIIFCERNFVKCKITVIKVSLFISHFLFCNLISITKNVSGLHGKHFTQNLFNPYDTCCSFHTDIALYQQTWPVVTRLTYITHEKKIYFLIPFVMLSKNGCDAVKYPSLVREVLLSSQGCMLAIAYALFQAFSCKWVANIIISLLFK